MSKKKRLFFSAVFSAYFIIFVVSPISGTAAFTRAYGQSFGALNLKLLISDLLQTGHDKPDDRLHHANVLLQKKRAILSDGSKTAGDHYQCLGVRAHACRPGEILHKVAAEDVEENSQNVQRSHSGLSPPSA